MEALFSCIPGHLVSRARFSGTETEQNACKRPIYDKRSEHTEKSQHLLPAKGCTPLAASIPHLIAASVLPTWARLWSVAEERPRMPCACCTLPSACERRGPKRDPPLPRGSREVELLRPAWRRRRRWMSPS